MLSPGKWHELVPNDLEENVKFRLDVLRECEINSEFRAGIMEICRLDIVFFIKVFVWQFNPLYKGVLAFRAIEPFIPWDCQVDLLLDRPETTGEPGILWVYDANKTCVVEKSREMGASWLFLIFQVWLSIFHDNSQTLNISRNEKMVDSASPDSLFWKLDFIHQWLPAWMTGPVVDQTMFIHYKNTNSYITGEPSTGAAGVGGRGGVAFIDEFSRIKEDQAVRQSTASTVSSRYFNGTHQGTETEFFRLTNTPEIIKLVLHWSQHPEKSRGLYRWDEAANDVEIIDKEYEFPPDYKFVRTGAPVGGPYPGLRSPWYDAKCIEIGNEAGVAQELDINPTGSTAQAFDPVLINRLILTTTRQPLWTGNVVKVERQYKSDEPDEYRLEEDAGSPINGPEAGPLKLWVVPDLYGRFPFAVYKMGGDLSLGQGRTNSCLSIGNADTGERIGEFVSPNIYPDHLAPIAVWLCRLLSDHEGNPAEMIWEKNGPGIRFGREVLALGFNNVFMNDTSYRELGGSIKGIPGWEAETKAKNLILSEHQSALRNHEFVNRSELSLKELLLFRWDPSGKKIYHAGSLNKKDPSGAGTNHGDRGMADTLLCKIMLPYSKKLRETPAEPEAPMYSYEWRQKHKKARRNDRGLSPIYD
jgi:hypothetical protein